MGALPVLALMLVALWAPSTPARTSLLTTLDVYHQPNVRGHAGFILAPRVALAKSLERVLHRFTATLVGDCAMRCLDDSECFVFEHCDAQDGCQQAEPHLGPSECLLVGSRCDIRVKVQASGAWIKRLAGFPIYHELEQVPGYEAHVAQDFDGGDFHCPGTQVSGWCTFTSLEEATAVCTAMNDCASIVHFLNGTDACSEPLVVLRSVVPSRTVVSPTVYTLSKLQPSSNGSGSGSAAGTNSDGGLSAGAVAGIAVGALSVGAAVLGGVAWLVLGRRRRRRRPQLKADSSIELEKNPSSLEKGSVTGGTEAPTGAHQQSKPPLPHFAALDGGGAYINMVDIVETGGRDSRGRRRPVPAAMPTRVVVAPSSVATSPFNCDAATPFASDTTTHPHPAASVDPDQSGTPSMSAGAAGTSASASTHSLGTAPTPTPASLQSRLPRCTTPPSSDLARIDAPRHHPSDHAQQPSQPALPELEAHVAQQDMLSLQAPSDHGSTLSPHQLVCADHLPPALRECLVDGSAVEYLQWPGGKLQEIGLGASSHVYKAMYLGELVAAKECNIARSRASQEAFIREAWRLHQLHHPHVVALYGVSLCGTTGLILMEYCGGRDLHSALQLMVEGTQERLFGWYRHGCRVAYEISKALNFLHAKGVVHMDLKSQNVLLTSTGVAKLADVGLARMQRGAYLSEVPLVGTLAWIAPEVLLGGQQCTNAVDIFSFGIMLWEILTGELPQRGSLRASRVPEECPQGVVDLMMDAVPVDPSKRPTAAHDSAGPAQRGERALAPPNVGGRHCGAAVLAWQI